MGFKDSSDFIRTIGATAAGAALDYIIGTPAQGSEGQRRRIFPNNPHHTGLVPYKSTEQMFKLKRRVGSRTRTVRKRRGKRRGGSAGGGIIGPPIPRPLPAKKPSKYDLYGSRGQDENYRTSTRDSINYLGFTSFKCTNDTTATASLSGSLSYHVAAALLRYIMKREFKADFMRHSQLVDLTHAQATTNLKAKIAFVAKTRTVSNETTYDVPYVLDIVSGTRFVDLAKAVCLNVITGIGYGGSGFNETNFIVKELAGYFIVNPDIGPNATTGTYAVHGQFQRLDNVYLKAYSFAEMAIQNVTTADVATAGEGQYLADRIDANPIQCRMFKFNDPVPKIREYLPEIVDTAALAYSTAPSVAVPGDTQDVNHRRMVFDQNADGVFSTHDAVAFTGDFDQLPPASRFEGCVGVSNFVLQPGEIRKFTLKFKFDGLINRFMKGQGLYTATPIRWNNPDALGTSIMIAAEKYMSTGASVKVSLNYQLSYFTGAYIKKPKQNILLPYDKDGAYTGASDPGT